MTIQNLLSPDRPYQRFVKAALLYGLAGGGIFAAIAPVRAQMPTAPSALTTARTARDQSLYAEAVTAYLQVIQAASDPVTLSTAEMELAWVYAYQKNYEASLALCNRLVQRDPQSEPWQLQRAEILSWATRYADALAAYQQVLTQNPESIPAMLGQAEVLSWSGRYAPAIAAYQAVLTRQADSQKALTGIAQIALWQGDLDNALQRFLKLRQQFPRSTAIQLGLAKTYQARQEIKPALAVLAPLRLAKQPEALAIAAEIHGVQSSTEFVSRSRSSEQNSLGIDETVQFRIGDSNVLQSVQLGYRQFSQPGYERIHTVPLRIGVAGTNYPVRWSLSAGADIADRLPPQPFVEGKVNLQVNPTLEVGATTSYQAYQENVATLENGIQVLQVQPHVAWKITPSTSFYAQYGAGFYSDGNRDHQLWAGLKQKWGGFYAEGSILSWTFAKDLSSGYFAPSDYFLYSGELGWQGKVADRATCQLAGALGQQSYGGDSQSVTAYKAGCNVDVSTTTRLDVQYRYSSSAFFTGATGKSNEQRFNVNLKTRF
jgi:tetratricopeptide (TPR) repeat protein